MGNYILFSRTEMFNITVYMYIIFALFASNNLFIHLVCAYIACTDTLIHTVIHVSKTIALSNNQLAVSLHMQIYSHMQF